jgi:hypothetical protein
VLDLRALPLAFLERIAGSDRLDICRILERCCARAPGGLLPCEKQALQLVLTFFFPISKAKLPPSAEVGQVVYQKPCWMSSTSRRTIAFRFSRSTRTISWFWIMII